MVVVPAGAFRMGSPADEIGRFDREGPVHRVTIGEAFAVGVYEVTRGQYEQFVRATGHAAGNTCYTHEESWFDPYGSWKERAGRNWREPGYQQSGEHPVVCVNREDTQAYTAWLSRESGAEYRLLSEAEWEYAARGGTETARYWGEGQEGACRYANWADESTIRAPAYKEPQCNDVHVRTAPVGSYTKNGFGLFDVLGNVYEWVEDCVIESYEGAPTDGTAVVERVHCGYRLTRGGYWYSYLTWEIRSASRSWFPAGYRGSQVGFRVARNLILEDRQRAAARAAQEEAARERQAERQVAADDTAYAAAEQADTAAAYEEYLEAYPAGRQTDAARERQAARRGAETYRVGRTFRDALRSGGEGPEMVVVPAGTFRMGCVSGQDCENDEYPVHRVTIGEAFAVGVYEVTFAEWDMCVRAGGCEGYRPDDEGWGRGRRPVINVSWEDAQAYVGWLSRESGAGYSLLSEAEWEYVARAGSETAHSWGNAIEKNRMNGLWFGWNLLKTKPTDPVGSFGANTFGLHDVHGNVWEFVEDCRNGSYEGAPTDGKAWTSGNCDTRMRRSSAWSESPRNLRSANRGTITSGYRSDDNGFRVTRSLTP